MIDTGNLKKTELKDLLKNLKLLNSLTKSLGNRGKKEFNKINNSINTYKIEYFDFEGNSIEYFKEKSVLYFNKMFGLNLIQDQIEFTQNNNLKGGIRVFYNDNMYDLSYKKFEKLMI